MDHSYVRNKLMFFRGGTIEYTRSSHSNQSLLVWFLTITLYFSFFMFKMRKCSPPNFPPLKYGLHMVTFFEEYHMEGGDEERAIHRG